MHIVQVNVLTKPISDTLFAWNVHFNSIPYATSSQASFLAYTILIPTLIYAYSPNSTPSIPSYLLYSPSFHIIYIESSTNMVNGAVVRLFQPKSKISS